jgi:hypothetical protein
LLNHSQKLPFREFEIMRNILMSAAAMALCIGATSSQAQEMGPFLSRPATSADITHVNATCPGNSFISAIQSMSYSDHEGYYGLNIWCKPLVKVDQMPTDLTEKEIIPYSKAPTNNGGGIKAACPDNYYVSGFQLFVDNDPSHQRSTIIWCKPLMPSGGKPPTGPATYELDTQMEPSDNGGSKRIESQDGYYFYQVELGVAQNGDRVGRALSAWTRQFSAP